MPHGDCGATSIIAEWELILASPTAQQKDLLRAHMKEIRAESAARDPDAADKLAKRFPLKLLDRFGPVVAGYRAINDELDPLPLLNWLRRKGAKIVLPRVESSGEMTFRLHEKPEDLVKGPFGLLQPASDAIEIRPKLVLAPLLAFDARGTRLGYGKGHYDRAIKGLREEGPCFFVGLGYAQQQVDAVPSEPHDIALDWAETPHNSVPLFLAKAAPQNPEN